jgi:hypothetical protein
MCDYSLHLSPIGRRELEISSSRPVFASPARADLRQSESPTLQCV